MDKIEIYKCDACSKADDSPCYLFELESNDGYRNTCVYNKDQITNWQPTEDYTISKPNEIQYILQIDWKGINKYNVHTAYALSQKDGKQIIVLNRDNRECYIEHDKESYWIPETWVQEYKPMTISPNVLIDTVETLLRRAVSRIPAIKFYRAVTGEGLKESKDAIEKIQANMSN